MRPSSTTTAASRLDGFDIGLIREIGKQLGVKVEIKDLRVDGLYNVLQLGQIDVAIPPHFRDAGSPAVRRFHEL